jgi:hypothetical protein
MAMVLALMTDTALIGLFFLANAFLLAVALFVATRP